MQNTSTFTSINLTFTYFHCSVPAKKRKYHHGQ